MYPDLLKQIGTSYNIIMHIIEVIPISRGISKEQLSYFTTKDIEVGSIVEVPLRKRTIPAIAISKKEAQENKQEIRGAEFQVKKIGKLSSSHFFLPEFIESARETATYFSSTVGGALSGLISSQIIKNLEKIKIELTPIHQDRIHQKYILQADDEERFANYKSFIREEFAKKSSVFFCLPTIHDIKKTVGKLEKGIEDYTYVLHSALGEKEILETLLKLSNEKHPVLILSTGIFLSFPRADLGAIIVDRQNSLSYKTQSRPYLDFRIFAELFAKKIKAKFVIGDIFIDVENLYRFKNGDFQELSPLKFRSLTSSKETVVDMKKYKGAGGHFTYISDELKELIQENKSTNENLYIYSSRKGLSPSTLCGDCGSVVSCPKCESHMVLHGSRKGNFFLCHRCGERGDPKEVCKTCGSWKLITLGVGIEKIEEEIRVLFPDLKIYVLQKEKATTHNKALNIAKQFYASPGSVLLGTEMALPYIDQEIENTAIASIDSLFSVPDFRVTEKIMALFLKLRSITKKKMLLQTRNPEQKVFEYGLAGNLFDFYRDEIAKREKFNYPPFSLLIKISVEGEKKDIVSKMSILKSDFEDETIDIFPSFIKGRGGKSIMHALLRIPRATWPNPKIISKLMSLSPEFTIKVDPESLL